MPVTIEWPDSVCLIHHQLDFLTSLDFSNSELIKGKNKHGVNFNFW